MTKVNDFLAIVPCETLRPEALRWYADPQVQWLVNGITQSYSPTEIENMYAWQRKNGALYYIELTEAGVTHTVGDVWLREDDFALVIDPAYQGKGIGTMIVSYFLAELKKAGAEKMVAQEVYHWNVGSNRLFQKLDFQQIPNGQHASYVYDFTAE